MRFYPHIFQVSGKQEMKHFSSTNKDDDFDEADDFGDDDSERNSGYQPPEMLS